ncbi:hypothetical protein [Botrimarina mediterranea]|uniref:hypothetical protein n=1 Tax=Botrimarina mediterranea TaxID=2528022 RepID=UPI00118908EB|nr:hypothetical protein K2D_33270 [Planctomycetes bacterium K2D]
MDLITATKYAEVAVGVGLVLYVLWRQTIQKRSGPTTAVENFGWAVVVLFFCAANALQRDWIGVGMWIVLAGLFYVRWRRESGAPKPGLFEPPSPD